MIMKILQLLLVLFVGLFPFDLNVNAAEDIYFTHIGLEEGLSNSTILPLIKIKKETYGSLRMTV